MQTHSLDLESSSSQYASIADASQTGLDLGSAATLECWVKFESTGADQTIINKNLSTGNQRSYAVRRQADGTLQFFASSNGSSTSGQFIGYRTTTAVPAGVWMFVAVTINLSTAEWHIYVDGRDMALTATNGNGTISTSFHNSTADFMIGQSGANSNYMDGTIAMARVFNDIRTSSEIISDAHTLSVSDANLVGEWTFNNSYDDTSGNDNDLTPSGSPTFATDVPWTKPDYISGSTYLETNLVSHWPLAGDGKDSTANGNDLTNNGAAADAILDGDGMAFTRSESDYMAITDASQAGLDLTADFSFVTWFKLAASPSTDEQYTFLSKYDQVTAGRSYSFAYSDEDNGELIELVVSSNGEGAGSTQFENALSALSTDTLYMAAVSYIAAQGRATFYIGGGGELRQVGSLTGGPNSIHDSATDFMLGAAKIGGSNTHFFDGTQARVSLYNRPLHYGDLLDHYNGGAGLPYADTPEVTTSRNALFMGGGL